MGDNTVPDLWGIIPRASRAMFEVRMLTLLAGLVVLVVMGVVVLVLGVVLLLVLVLLVLLLLVLLMPLVLRWSC